MSQAAGGIDRWPHEPTEAASGGARSSRRGTGVCGEYQCGRSLGGVLMTYVLRYM